MAFKITPTGSFGRHMDDCTMVGRSARLQEQRGSLPLADMGTMGSSLHNLQLSASSG